MTKAELIAALAEAADDAEVCIDTIDGVEVPVAGVEYGADGVVILVPRHNLLVEPPRAA